MAEHNENMKHPIAFSFSDAEFWCYNCDSYVINEAMAFLAKSFGILKHEKAELFTKFMEISEKEKVLQQFE